MRLSTLILAGALVLGGPASASEPGGPVLDPTRFGAVTVAYADGMVQPRRQVRRRHVRLRRKAYYGRPPGCDCRRRVYYFPHEYPNELLEELPTHKEVRAPYFRRYYKARVVKYRRRPAALVRAKG